MTHDSFKQISCEILQNTFTLVRGFISLWISVRHYVKTFLDNLILVKVKDRRVIRADT